MSFKKYVFSMIICAVTIFVMMFDAFVPVKSYADDSGGWAIDWFGTELWTDKKNNLQSEDVYYLQIYYDRMYSLIGFSISPSEVKVVSLNEYYDKITLTFDNVPKDGYFINSYIYSAGKIIYAGHTSTSQKTDSRSSAKNMYYIAKKVEVDDTSLLDNFLYNVLGIKELLSDTIDEVSNSPVGEFFSKLGSDFKDYVKTTLGITDEDTLSNVITEISTNNYISDVWNNVPEKTKKGIQYTYSNLKHFIYNNVDTTQDSDGKYHYIVKNYNPVTNTYLDYFYNENYFYENILYKNDTDLDDTNNWLQKIYNAIIDLPNHVKSTVTTNVTNTYNYLFVPSEEDIQDLFSDFINTDDDGNITYSNSLLACCTSLVDSVFSADDIYNSTVSTYALTNNEEEVTSNAPKWTMDFSFINQAFDDDFIENTNYVVIDFSVLDNYISTIRIILVSFSYLMFAWSIIKKEYNRDDVLS